MIKVEYKTDFVPQSDKIVSFGLCQDRKFRRLAGGVHWPTISSSGFALILTEDPLKNTSTHLYHLNIIEEKEDSSIYSLLQWCEMRGANMPHEIPITWFADTNQRPQMQAVWDMNREMRAKGRRDALNFSSPPYVDFKEDERNAFYHQNLLKYLRNDAIGFSENSKIPGFLHMSVDKLTGPILALAFVLSAMAIWPDTGKIME